ncbi:MAG: hypothetical protein ACR2QL_01210, partial [Woeseiaceae bacterium]
MKKQWLIAALTALVLGFSSFSASAGDVGLSVEFTDNEISVIRAYYQDHSSGGSKKGNGNNGKGKKSLPPGIEKNLQRGK